MMSQMANDRPIDTIFEALSYEAPFLIEKLLKEKISETTVEAELLFTEVKKYIVLVHMDYSKLIKMHSLRIDEVWHQFILFTREYTIFSHRYFGKYIDHSPSNAPEITSSQTKEELNFEEFRKYYESIYKTALPDIWHDEKTITTNRRVLNDHASRMFVTEEDEMVSLSNHAGIVIFSINELAREAITFVARTGAFYVRELPGNLTDDEKIALVSTLVENKLLRVGS